MTWLARHFNPAFVVAAAILILVLPHIAANEYELRLITLLMIYAIIALGLNVLVGLTGLVSLGQAGLYAIGAYTAAILATRLGVGLVPGLILGMALAGAFGVLLAYPTVRVRGVYLAVVTIAFGIIVENVAIEWDSLTGSWVGISNVPAPTLLGLPLDYKSYFIVVGASALIAYLVNVNLMNSRFGRAMRATAQSEIASRSLGINVGAIRTLAFVVSAIAAGAAGVFYVYLNKYISPDIFSFTDSVRFLLMVILGGSGTALGPVVGASIMTYLPEYLQAFGHWQSFAYGLLLAAVMFFLPRGIVGSIGTFVTARLGERRPQFAADARPRLSDIISVEQADGSACLDARGVSVAFGGLVAVDKVNETIDTGEIHALIGPNGAGKSTFLNAISGVYRADAGSITFLGRETTRLPSHQLARLGLARTFQNTELFSDMTVLENVLVAFHKEYRSNIFSTICRLPSFRRDERHFRQAAMALLSYVGLSAFAHEKAANLAFGHQRQLEIARALALSPKLLLLDEPAAGLTHAEIEQLISLVRDLAANGITVLIVEHHVELIMEISDHVTVLDYGELIASGSATEVQTDPKVIEAYFGSQTFGNGPALATDTDTDTDTETAGGER